MINLKTNKTLTKELRNKIEMKRIRTEVEISTTGAPTCVF
jgi:hypothetical protein